MRRKDSPMHIEHLKHPMAALRQQMITNERGRLDQLDEEELHQLEDCDAAGDEADAPAIKQPTSSNYSPGKPPTIVIDDGDSVNVASDCTQFDDYQSSISTNINQAAHTSEQQPALALEEAIGAADANKANTETIIEATRIRSMQSQQQQPTTGDIYERSFDLNQYEDESDEEKRRKEDAIIAQSEAEMSALIRRMSRTNKWTPVNESDEGQFEGTTKLLSFDQQRSRSVPANYDDAHDSGRGPLATYGSISEGNSLKRSGDIRTKSYGAHKPPATTSTVRSPTSKHHYVPQLHPNFNAAPTRPVPDDSSTANNIFGRQLSMPASLQMSSYRRSISGSPQSTAEKVGWKVVPSYHSSEDNRRSEEVDRLGSQPIVIDSIRDQGQQRSIQISEAERGYSISLRTQDSSPDDHQEHLHRSDLESAQQRGRTEEAGSRVYSEDRNDGKLASDSTQVEPLESRRSVSAVIPEHPSIHVGEDELHNTSLTLNLSVKAPKSQQVPLATTGQISPTVVANTLLAGSSGERSGDSSSGISSKPKTKKSSNDRKVGMPAIEKSVVEHRSGDKLTEHRLKDDSAACIEWNPTSLVTKLYEISYEPRKESKLNRFTNMEGHLEVPVDEQSVFMELQKNWVQRYFRTRDGRLQWFASHFADDTPVGEVLLSGCDVDANRDENTLRIHGGRDYVRMILRIPPAANVFDKWRKAINSHAASSYLDAFVNPVYPPLPHITEKVAIIELGSCSIRAGVLTMEPSLPQSFFPTMAMIKDNGEIIVGADALLPQNRHSGEFVRPLRATDSSTERYTFHRLALKACLQKCVNDLKINPTKYRLLLSIPQNLPVSMIAELLKIILKEIRFQGAAISRQPSLILYAYDVTTGVVVDIGDCLNIVPVIDGYVVDSAIVSLPYGATQILSSLQTKLAESNIGAYKFQSPTEQLILRYIMEQACYVATNYDQEVEKCKSNEKDLQTIVSFMDFEPVAEMVSSARFTATEGLFKPKRWGLDTKGLHQLVFEAVQSSPIDSRKTLFKNIYLAGGVSLFPGLAERLEVEVASLVASAIHAQVHLSPWRYNAAYLGAQVIASSTQFEETCITQENLEEFIKNLQNATY